ncbi:hypothetical protein P5673_019009 [Acropora cervicornis]|uniref:Uncharacterized protein n=1 Tax=Acropora cervicornis TaxID=6130 RepID=A0AAD9QCH2_ACRCE|nr:hypothetical protein P5673_019009 [Acropora cervicornis]
MAYNIKVLGAWTLSSEFFLLVAFMTIVQETGAATNTVRKILNQFCSACTLTPFWKGDTENNVLEYITRRTAGSARRHRRHARHFSFSLIEGNKVQEKSWKEIFKKENNMWQKHDLLMKTWLTHSFLSIFCPLKTPRRLSSSMRPEHKHLIVVLAFMGIRLLVNVA